MVFAQKILGGADHINHDIVIAKGENGAQIAKVAIDDLHPKRKLSLLPPGSADCRVVEKSVGGAHAARFVGVAVLGKLAQLVAAKPEGKLLFALRVGVAEHAGRR